MIENILPLLLIIMMHFILSIYDLFPFKLYDYTVKINTTNTAAKGLNVQPCIQSSRILVFALNLILYYRPKKSSAIKSNVTQCFVAASFVQAVCCGHRRMTGQDLRTHMLCLICYGIVYISNMQQLRDTRL